MELAAGSAVPNQQIIEQWFHGRGAVRNLERAVPEPTIAVDFAQQLYYRGAFAQAHYAWRQLLQRSQDDVSAQSWYVQALQGLAEADLALGRRYMAQQAARTLISLRPLDVESWLLLIESDPTERTAHSQAVAQAQALMKPQDWVSAMRLARARYDVDGVWKLLTQRLQHTDMRRGEGHRLLDMADWLARSGYGAYAQAVRQKVAQAVPDLARARTNISQQAVPQQQWARVLNDPYVDQATRAAAQQNMGSLVSAWRTLGGMEQRR